MSEQEQRDLENLIDPMNIREQLQPPTPGEMPSPRDCVISGSAPVMSLTRESLWKHTLLQEQLYLASASPERSILFLNDAREVDSPASSSRRQSLKRIHSPDLSTQQCKTGRRNDDNVSIPTTGSVLNPVFPLLSFGTGEKYRGSNALSAPKATQVVVPVQMYPIVSLQSSGQISGGQINSSQSPDASTSIAGRHAGSVYLLTCYTKLYT